MEYRDKEFNIAHFEEAVKPVKTKIKSLQNGGGGYVYIIHKRFPPRDNSKVFNLFKVGYTDIEKDGQLSRLNSFRTTLISFKVHRIYLFSKNQTGRGAAHDAEQQLHKALDRDFNAKSVRMMHSDDKMATEWWKVEPKDVKAFLDFCDYVMREEVNVPPAYATKFLRTDAKVLKFEKPPDNRVRYVNGKAVELSASESRKTNSPHVRGKKKREREVAERAERAYKVSREQKDIEKHPELETTKKSVAFWKDVLVGEKFQDKQMYDDDPAYFDGKKIITDVVYKRGSSKDEKGKTVYSFYQPFVVYEPVTITKRHTYQIDDASGFMNIPEVLNLYFPELKKKYKKGYDMWRKKNQYNEKFDYRKGTKR